MLRFCTYISCQPHFDLEPDYIKRKGIRHRIQRCNLRREILSTFHTRVNHRSVHHFPVTSPIVNNTTNISKNATNHARNSPFPLTHVDLHLTYECLDPPHSPSQTTARSLYALSHNDAKMSPLVTMGSRKFNSPPPPNCPFPFDDHHQNLIHRARPHSPPQTASGSNQPFCHNANVRTDRRVEDISVTLALCSAILIVVCILVVQPQAG